MEQSFLEIIQIIKQSRSNAIKAVNSELINLYWNVGLYISSRLKRAEWGDNTINEFAIYIQRNNPELKGFSRSGIYRMIQFYDIYCESQFVASLTRQIQVIEKQEDMLKLEGLQENGSDIRHTLLTRISWTHHVTIFSRCKSEEEREFYILQSVNENYSVRELERQISASLFERFALGKTTGTQGGVGQAEDLNNVFKDSYIFDFLNLPESYSEGDLQKGLIVQMKDFILELGKEFLFVDQEYKVTVGGYDFYMDLLFYHRGLQCLVVFELKADRFKPEHIGQLNFYLEALDRDVKKEHENPSIGILLCTDKNKDVVEYSLSRSLSPTMVAEYKMQLPNKEILQRKLQELRGD